MQFTNTIWRQGGTASLELAAMSFHNAALMGRAAMMGFCWSLTAPQALLAAMARGVSSGEATPTSATAAQAVADSAPVVEPVAERVEEQVIEQVETAEASPRLLDAPRDGAADELSRIRGVGPKLAATLQEVGIYHFDQIAELNQEGLDWLTANLPGFRLAASRYDLRAGAAECLTDA